MGASDLYAFENCHDIDPNVTMNNALVLPFYSNKYNYYSLYYIPVFSLAKSPQIIMHISAQTK